VCEGERLCFFLCYNYFLQYGRYLFCKVDSIRRPVERDNDIPLEHRKDQS